MSIRFIVDSVSDFNASQVARLKLDMIPIGISIDENSYLDGVDIDLEHLSNAMKEERDVKTFQCTYKQFYDVFIKYAQTGDEVVYFSFSGGISGNYQSATLVAREILEEYPEYKLHVVDTKLALDGIQCFILDAIKLRDRGATVEDIVKYLEYFREEILLFASVEDLYYLIKGGRLSNAKAVMANMLNVKPVLRLIDGDLVSVGKVRGIKKFYKFFAQELKKELSKKDDNSDKTIYICHFMNYDGIATSKSVLEKQFGIKNFVVSDMSTTIGVHLGPSAISLLYSPVDPDSWELSK